LFIWLISYDRKYCWLIYYENKRTRLSYTDTVVVYTRLVSKFQASSTSLHSFAFRKRECKHSQQSFTVGVAVDAVVHIHIYMLYKSNNCMYLHNIPSLRHVQYKKGLHTITETDLPALFQPRYRSNTPSLPSTKPLLSSRNLCHHKQHHITKCF
jgi:hypothetical protein